MSIWAPPVADGRADVGGRRWQRFTDGPDSLFVCAAVTVKPVRRPASRRLWAVVESPPSGRPGQCWWRVLVSDERPAPPFDAPEVARSSADDPLPDLKSAMVQAARALDVLGRGEPWQSPSERARDEERRPA